MHLRISLFLIFIVLGLTSCEDFFEQVVEIDIPEHEPALAITAEFSSSDTLLGVYVSHSQGVLDTSLPKPMRDATVQLFREGDLLYELPYQEEFQGFIDGIYAMEIDNPLGDEPAGYSLKVAAPGYTTVESFQVMPKPVPVIDFEYTEDGTIDIDGERTNEVKVVIADPPGVENFYSFLLEVNISNPHLIEDVFFVADLQSTDILVEEGDSELLLSDESFDGKEQTIRFYSRPTFSENSTVTFYFHLRSVTKEKYLYSRALNIYYESEDNPFAEPIVVPSNIENGYGLFSVESEMVFEKVKEF